MKSKIKKFHRLRPSQFTIAVKVQYLQSFLSRKSVHSRLIKVVKLGSSKVKF